jgi:hypothetical protein
MADFDPLQESEEAGAFQKIVRGSRQGDFETPELSMNAGPRSSGTADLLLQLTSGYPTAYSLPCCRRDNASKHVTRDKSAGINSAPTLAETNPPSSSQP